MKKSLLIILCTLMSLMSWAQNRADGTAEPYAVVSENNTVLTFYYDDQKEARNGMSVGPFSNYDNVSWYANRGTITKVVFDESFANCTLLTSTAYWFYQMRELTTIEGISNFKTDNVTDMRYMFSDCSWLTSLDVSGFKTDNVTDMSYMFSGCSWLTSLDVSGFKTDNVTDMSYMFSGCSSLTSLDVSGFNTANVTDMNRLFGSCRSLTSLDVSGFNTANVTDMTGMFGGCSGLTSLDVSGFKTDNVTNMGGMFGYCSGLTSLNVNGFKTDNVTDMSSMFSGCSGLTSLDVSGFNTTNVTEMSGMFNDCTNLNALDLSNFDNSNVTYLLEIFNGCTNLVDINLSGWKNTKVKDMQCLFSNLQKLENINLTNFKTDSVTNMSNMFSGCSSLISLDVSDFNTDNVTNMSDMFAGCSELATIKARSGWSTANVTYGIDMFSNCTKLVGGAGTVYDENHTDYTYAHIDGGENNPGYFTNINTGPEPYAVLSDDKTVLTFYYDNQMAVNKGLDVRDVAWMIYSNSIISVVFHESFVNCTSLTSTAFWFYSMSSLTTIMGISNLKTDNVANMSNMFSGCSSLTSLDLSHFNTANVANMSGMFEGCSSLTSLDLSHFNTANVTDMSGMFAYCANLNSLDLSNFDTSNVTNISEMFSRCTNLVDINLSGWKNTKVTNMQSLFSNTEKLEHVNLTNFKTDSVTNMSGMFEGCYALTSLDLTGFNTAKVTDMSEMFWGCYALTSLDLTGFNTAKVTDMSGMFASCHALTSLDLTGFNTANVTYMSWMFSGCSGLINLNVNSFKTDNVMNMNGMFSGCSALKTINAGSEWSTANVSQGEYMFRDCTSLVGGAGTVFDENHIDHTYAHIDGGVSNPGYFTDKNAAPFVAVEPYAVLSENNTVVTFYYDDQKTARGGVDINNSYTNHYSSAKTVVFDASFANYRPESTAYWFNGLKDLETFIGLEYLNTSNVTSFKNMFKGCRSLKNLDLSGFDASKVTDMKQMFEDCSSLKNLNLRNFNTDSATNMGDMFCECSSLESLDLSSFNTVNVTKMSYMFAYCSSLKTLDLSSFNTRNVTNMEGLFHEDSLLTTIYVGESWSTENVSTVEQDEAKGTMFHGCIALVGGAGTPYDSTHVDYTYAHIDGGESNPGYFTKGGAQGPSVTVVAPEFRFEGDNLTMSTTTQNASIFYNMAELPSMAEAVVDSVVNSLIVTPDGQQSTYYEHPLELKMAAVVKAIAVADNATGTIVSDTTTMVYDYEAWVNLKAAVTSGVDLYGRAQGNPNVNTQLLEQLQWALNEGDMIYNNRAQMDSFEATHFTQRINELCAQIEAQMAAEDEPYAVLSENNTILTFYYDTNKSAYRDALSVGPFDAYATRWDGHSADITTVVFDASFANDTILSSTSNWFHDCSNLTNITGLEYLNTSNVTDMSLMFQNCSNLLSIDVSKFNTAKVINMEHMFMGCSALTSLDLNNFNTANVTNMGMMFFGCSGLSLLNVSSFNTANVTNMYGMFNGCSSLTSLDVSSFNTANVTNIQLMFSECGKLTSLDLSSFNTANVTNMDYLFYSGTSELTTIYVGSGWTTESVTSGGYMFTGCLNLVGGKGTAYANNYDHNDYTYARIDGGPDSQTPGYFTDKNAPITVAAPEFRFEGDNLAMTTETQNASIFYKVAELPSMAEAVVDSVVNSLIVTPDGQQSTYYEHPLELKMAAVVKAIAVADNATGTIVSDTTTMVYDYEAWVNLKAAVTSGVDLYGRAQGNPNVNTQLLEQLQWALNEGDMIYNNRAQMDSFEATHFTQRINELCAQIEAQMTPTEQVATPNFSWQNDELTISTTTEGADIYYWLSDVDVNGDGVITDADYAHYNNPLTIQRDVTIKAYAAKQAMDNSEIRTLDYPYTSWQTLREVISYASSVADRARHSAKVPDQEVASFEEDIAASYDMYEHRTETKDRVEEVARYLSERAYEIERMMEVEATFVDGVLTIEGNTTVAEALESFGVSTVTESIAAIVYNSSVPMANSDLQAITNPNLLIYVKSDSLAPADRNNIIVDGFAKNIVLTDVAQGNNDFYCPQSFTAEAISYTREFKQKTQIGVSRGWETIALPFNVQTIMHETRGLITPFGNNRSNSHFWLRRLTHDGLQSDSIIEANTAYLISMPNSEEYIADYNLSGHVTFSAENATVPMTEVVKDESADYVMTPCFTNAAAKQGIYVLNVGEQRSGYPEGSIFESNYRAVLPFQAYVEHKGSNPAPPYFIVGDLGGDTTGIMDNKRETITNNDWYTLDGRKLQGKPTQKGVYITNGKKVIIK